MEDLEPAAQRGWQRTDRPVRRGAQALGRLAGAAMLLSLASCYGILLLVAALSLVGLSLPLHNEVWAGAATFFAVVTAVAVALGYRQHRLPGPLAPAVAGVALIVWVMFGQYDRLVEAGGFVGLATAVVWDWRLRRKFHYQEKPYARDHA